MYISVTNSHLHMKLNYFIAVLLSIIVTGCASLLSPGRRSIAPVEQLKSELAQKFDDSNFVNAHWGVLIQSLKTGETIYARNERKMFMPASNMKLVTSSAATMLLTPEYRYMTRLMTNGEIRDSVLVGDLIVVGSGDPTISGRFDSGNVTITFTQWTDSLKMLGIKSIKGNIIGDDNCFDDDFYGTGWSADYETDYYAAQINGLPFNDNCIDITIVPTDSAGQSCSVAVIPNTAYVQIVNQTMTAAPSDSVREIIFERSRGTNVIYVRGTISAGSKPWTESVTVENPTLYTVTVLKEVLESNGIPVGGTPLDGDELRDTLRYDSARQLASYTSPPYSEIMKVINKPSQNFYTEQVVRTIGKEVHGVGSMKNGRKAALPVLAQWGVDTARLRYADGSGLSRLNLVTPSDIVSILSGISKGKYFSAFYESLPIAGVDGSIKHRMKGTSAEGNVHAKTGYIGYVRALSGYVTSRDGEMFVFSMIANHYTVPTSWAEQIQNSVCVALSDFSRTPSAVRSEKINQ